MKAEEHSETRLARKVRQGQLLELYGPLLTERQREFVRLHHNEDLSLGEIAREFHVSRQAVHDAVRQAETSMEHYEQNLCLLGRPAVRATTPGGAEPEPAAMASPAYEEFRAVIADLEAARRRLATQGIIYDSAAHVRALDEVISRLRALLGFEQTAVR
jgi:predicted DNA-binding protein YlxM (UPF0122 family)